MKKFCSELFPAQARSARSVLLLGMVLVVPAPGEGQVPEGERATLHVSGSWTSEMSPPLELRENLRAWGLQVEFDRDWRIRPHAGASRVTLRFDCQLPSINGATCPDPQGWLLVAGGSADLLPENVSSPIVPYLAGEAGFFIRPGENQRAWAGVAGVRIPVHPNLSLKGEVRRARLDRALEQHWQALVGIQLSR